MSKKILIVFGTLFLILFLGNVSAEDICWVEASSDDCITNNGQVVMSVSGATNAHGALAGQGTFIPVLCCNFGEGDTTCTADNKVLGLSSSTNAHAEAPDLGSPNYNIDVCYDSLKDCRRTTDSCSVAMNEIPVICLSSGEAQLYTNAHIEDADLGDNQNYDTKICCVVESVAQCDLTSSKWQYEEVMEEGDVEAIVNGTAGCSGVKISFEVFREKAGTDDACSDITGCENPPPVTFAAGSNSVAGIWTAAPYHDNEYYFVATVVANPDESMTSSEPNLLVTELPPGYCLSIAICSHYETEGYCNPDPCEVAEASVPSDVDCSVLGINCACVWEDNECKASWDAEDIYHTECIDNMCVKVSGPGVNECSPIGSGCDITDPNFNVCLGPACVLELGVGEDQCNESGDCIGQPESHTECIDNMCVRVSGLGVSECLPVGGTCDLPSESHSICVNQMCMLKEGSGENQCSSNADCGEPSMVVGKCVYNQTITNSCEEEPFGSLSFSWTGEWTWDDGCDVECQIANKDKKDLCEEGGTRTFECPAQIPLPFFNIYSFIAALIIIALIYVVLTVKKEKRKR